MDVIARFPLIALLRRELLTSLRRKRTFFLLFVTGEHLDPELQRVLHTRTKATTSAPSALAASTLPSVDPLST